MQSSNRINSSVNKIKSKLQPKLICKNPFSHSASKICDIRYFSTSLEKLEDSDQVKIASISLPGINSEFKEISNKEDYPLNLKVVPWKRTFSKQLLEEFKKTIKYACQKQANIICINELGMPLNSVGNTHKEAIRFAKSMAQKHNCLIVAGSNHCKDTFVNRGYIFFPDKEKETDQEFITFYKNISATGVGEDIYTPSQRIIFSTKAFGLQLSFLICLELVDYSSSTMIAKSSQNIDMLIVPTYLENYGALDRVAKSLSKAIGSVLLTNCNKGPDFPLSRIYKHGNVAQGNKRKESKVSESVVIIRNLNVKDFKKKKLENWHSMDDQIKCLFGTGINIR